MWAFFREERRVDRVGWLWFRIGVGLEDTEVVIFDGGKFPKRLGPVDVDNVRFEETKQRILGICEWGVKEKE
jgi:hypothetical protein